jgi:uncharacterized protein (DUF58 family)
MLTSRGLWFLLWVLALLGLSLWANVPALSVVCLTLLFWLLGSWVAFVVQLRLLDGRLHVERQASDERGVLQSLWAGQAYRIRARLLSDRPFPSPYVRVTDRVPFTAKLLTGTAHAEGSVAAGEPLQMDYFLYCMAPGILRFEGVTVQMADAQGLFYHEVFLQDVSGLRVLPPLADARGHVPTIKRHNVIPLLGAHRLRRPGSGSELLDLRDYLPGDPPKTIAWKVSARRDRLMTKEFESEVPVRCTLFVDTSQSVRVGSPLTCSLTRLVEISAAVAQATAGARDLAGVCLCDERVTHYVRPARGARHLVKLMGLLADAAGLPPAPARVPVTALLALAYAVARDTYPQLLADDLNAFPFWLPLLSPQPAYTLRRPPLRARSLLHRPLVWLRLLLRRTGAGCRQTLLARLSPRTHLFYRWRKQLAAVLSVRYGLVPGGLALLLEDDDECARYLQRFLAEHQVPYQPPLYDAEGRYLFAAPGKVSVLARALLHAVARGRDNELFVLLADLLEIGDHLGPLLRAVKVALARHHQVLVVCPWPVGVPPPPREHQREQTGKSQAAAAETLVARTTIRRLHRAYHQLRRTLGRLGVRVLCAAEGHSVRLILERLEQLRTQRRRAR